MTEIIAALKTKPTEIEFDISVEGIKPNGMKVRMCVKTDKFSILLDCSNVSKEKWKCVLPPLDFMDDGAYKFNIEVVADGYFFEVTKGTLDISKSHEIYVKNMKTSVKPKASDKKDDEDKKDKDDDKKEKKEESLINQAKKVLSNDISAAKIANSILKETTDNTSNKKSSNPDDVKAAKLRNILDSYRRNSPLNENNTKRGKFGSFLNKGKQVRLN